MAKGRAAAPIEWVDDRDLARRTPLSRDTWQTLRARGKGPPYYKVGKRVFYRWHEVEAWIETHRIAPITTAARRPKSQR